MHFKKGELVIIFMGFEYSDPVIIHSIDKMGHVQSRHVSNFDILYYKKNGTVGRADIFYVFHAQECDAVYCKKYLKLYGKKQLEQQQEK
jgi:hypothetical protein